MSAIDLSLEGIEGSAKKIEAILGSRKPQLFVIADELVALLYLKTFTEALQERGFAVFSATFPPGETHKTLSTVSSLLDKLAVHKFARDDFIIGLGGGISTDIAGFVAAIYQRGINWIAVPTLLLGMVDAAIGGKTGVDHPLGKNMIGSFHHPEAVVVPLYTLNTLSDREWNSGSAEVVKAALIHGDKLWEKVSELGPNLGKWPRDQVYEMIPKSAKVKLEIVEHDERESGLRRMLNLGHTFGHALESVTGYQTFLHGEAVFLGLRAMIKLSILNSVMREEDSTQIERILNRVTFPSAEINFEKLIEALSRDKKVKSGKINWILLKKIGEPVVITGVSDESIRKTAEWLVEICKAGNLPTAYSKKRKKLLVLNGPNLNLLGIREPSVYGNVDYSELKKTLQEFAELKNIELLILHSNHEGELVDHIQWSRHWADGIVLNPGGYTHSSVAIRDAIAAVKIPTIEVHLSDIHTREEFRKVSLTAQVCLKQIAGKGIQGYIEALESFL